MEEQGEYKVIDKRMQEETVGAPVDTSTNAVVMMAMQKNYEPAFIDKMLDLQMKFEANEARKAYHEAMSQFKANPPKIEKDRKVSYKAGGGLTEYRHASLANVCEKINAGLGEYGLSAAWKTEQADKGITVTCSITHKMGHSESTSLFAAPDTSGSKNSIQAIGSTISYLERYTILALTGLATGDMDDDGNLGGGTIEYITEKQVSELTEMIKNTGTNTAKFLEYLGSSLNCEIDSVEHIPERGYRITIAVLKAKAKEKAKEKPEAKDREPGEDG